MFWIHWKACKKQANANSFSRSTQKFHSLRACESFFFFNPLTKQISNKQNFLKRFDFPGLVIYRAYYRMSGNRKISAEGCYRAAMKEIYMCSIIWGLVEKRAGNNTNFYQNRSIWDCGGYAFPQWNSLTSTG